MRWEYITDFDYLISKSSGAKIIEIEQWLLELQLKMPGMVFRSHSVGLRETDNAKWKLIDSANDSDRGSENTYDLSIRISVVNHSHIHTPAILHQGTYREKIPRYSVIPWWLMAIAIASRKSFGILALYKSDYLWPPYVIGQAIIFSSCGFFFYLLSFFSSHNLSGRRLDVYHTSTHGVALVRI